MPTAPSRFDMSENHKKAAGKQPSAPAADLSAITAPLLAWYRQNRRVLPFREDPTPYHVWVSEIMLQQTQVATALPFYERFVAELPDAAALAACDEGRLHKLWEGLGYYSRVRNMQRAAQLVAERHGGELPGSFEALRALPGIGDYTAGAIASIAFGLPHVAVDGNVLRVAARLLFCRGDIGQPAVRRALAAAVETALPQEAPGDFNQALMELGALVCTPKGPRCGTCPLRGQCRAGQAGQPAAVPVKAQRKPKPETPACLLVVHAGGAVLLHRRPQSGLLAGLWQPPLYEGEYTKAQAQKLLDELVPGAKITGPLPKATHVFTHRVWRLYGWQCAAPAGAPPPKGDYRYATPAQLEEAVMLPSAFKAYSRHLRGEAKDTGAEGRG